MSEKATQIDFLIAGFDNAKGGTVTAYAAGTTDLKTIWEDRDKATPAANPFTLNASRGAAQLYGDGMYKFVIKDSTGQVITGGTLDNIAIGLSDGPWVDVANYASLTAAITAIGSTETDLLIDSTTTLTGDTTIPTNVRLRKTVKGLINHGSYALTINGPLESHDLSQWFSGSGLVTFGIQSVPFILPHWFGGIPDEVVSDASMYSALQKVWASALASEKNIYHPSGVYDVGVQNFPYRHALTTSLLDCKNITVYGDGPATVLKTDSVDGADVLQLQALKNIHFRNFRIMADVSGAAAGSNGISITSGFDNITILDVCMENLTSIDSGGFVNGGGALTVQIDPTSNKVGSLVARIAADGCAKGFEYQIDLVTAMTNQTAVDVQVDARNCYLGVSLNCAAATGALSADMFSGVKVVGTATDCQHPVSISRAHGAYVDIAVQSTKTAANKQLTPAGAAWLATDTTVDGVVIAYAKSSRIRVTGNAGACDYKARIGGAAAGSSGLNGATEFCDISLMLAGTAATADILSIDSGGNTVSSCNLEISQDTASTVPTAWLTVANSNTVTCEGSFTATLTGCTATITGTGYYYVNKNTVTLEIPALSGTSNTTAATVTGIPTEIAPAATKAATAITIDNSVEVASRVNIYNTGIMDLYSSPTSGIFTNSGTKGFLGLAITYGR